MFPILTKLRDHRTFHSCRGLMLIVIRGSRVIPRFTVITSGPNFFKVNVELVDGLFIDALFQAFDCLNYLVDSYREFVMVVAHIRHAHFEFVAVVYPVADGRVPLFIMWDDVDAD